MSDTLLSTLVGGSGSLLSIDAGNSGGIESGNSCGYTTSCANENEATQAGVSLHGAAGECAERLHSLAILGSTDEVDNHSETLSPSGTKLRGMQRSKPRALRTGGAGSSASAGTGSRSIIQCLMCQKTFNNSSALAKHKLIHSDERKYACTLCSKAFKRQDHLNGHMMTHYSKKPYECKFSGCDKSYCDARSLRRHLENHHQQLLSDTSSLSHSDSGALTPASAPPDATGAVFNFELPFLQQQHPGSPGSISGLTNMTSNGSSSKVWPAGFYPFDEPKRVKCTVCDRRFRNLPALNGHMRLHGGYMKKDAAEVGNKLENSPHDSSSPTINMAKLQLQKHSSSSHHLVTSSSPPVEVDSQLIVVKPEVNCGGSVMSVNPVCSTLTYDDSQCIIHMGRPNVEDTTTVNGQNRFFGYNWIDGERSSVGLEAVTVKPEPTTDAVGQTGQYDEFVSQDIELTRFVGSRDQYLGQSCSFDSRNCMNDVCLGSTDSSQQHADGRVNGVDILASDVSMKKQQQQQMLVDDGLVGIMFGSSSSPLISSHSMPVLPTYTAPEVTEYPTAGYRIPGMFTDKSQSFVDASFSHGGGSTPRGYGGVMQHDMLAGDPESGYGRSYGYSDQSPHEVMHFQNSDQRSDGYFSSVPRTPTLYTAVGPRQVVPQQSGHRTPRTPYTPGTPSRASRFQFPSITEGAVVSNCQHRYQKSTAYHPYGHQHAAAQAQQLTTLGPSSPHYLNQRHVASIAHEMDQQQFRHDVAHAQQEIEQRLQQLQHEDKMKQMIITQQTNTDSTCFTGLSAQCHPTSDTNSSSADNSARNDAASSHSSHDTRSYSPVEEVLQLIMRDAPEISANTVNAASAVPMTTALQLKSEGIHRACAASYPHSASDSLLSQITSCSSLAYDQTDLKKLRRKHKPEPLFIPPDVNNFGTGDCRMQWNGVSSKAEFLPNTSAVIVNQRMGGGTHWLQHTSHAGEPHSAPPFHWSSAVMSFSNFDADSVLADLPP